MLSSKYLTHKSSCVATKIDYTVLDSSRWVTILDDCVDAINQAIAELTAAEAIERLNSTQNITGNSAISIMSTRTPRGIYAIGGVKRDVSNSLSG